MSTPTFHLQPDHSGPGPNPVLAEVIRGHFVESAHRGSVVVVEPGGSISFARGRVDVPILPRSANKPLQAVAMVHCQLDLPPDLLAVVCSSHSGQPQHIERAVKILDRYGLSEADLQNIPDFPVDTQEKYRWLSEGRSASRLAQNCSGKHAGMVATCVANGWDVTTYRTLGHPLQQAIAATLAEAAGEPVTAAVTDGCGAPVMALTLTGLARAFAHVAVAPPNSPAGKVATAIRDNPDLVGGKGRDVTTLIQLVPGLVAKDGAEAVYAAGLADGRGIALKIDDGGQRARPVVMAAVLRLLGVGAEAAKVLEDVPVLGHGQRVGSVRYVEEVPR